MLKIGLCFLPPLGAKKKLVACFLKSKPLILKSEPLIFHPFQTRMNKGLASNVKCGHVKPENPSQVLAVLD